jgi:hypothetical protein
MGAVFTIDDLEIFVQDDLTGFEMERSVGESERDFQQAKAMYSLLFSTVRLAVNGSGRGHN